MEIERKYLVKGDEWRKKVVGSYRIAQAYLSADPQLSVRVRLRYPCDMCGNQLNSKDEDRGAQAFLTIKSASTDGGLSRHEFEYEIPLEHARQLLKLCRTGIIDKVRHLIPLGSLTIEMDEFLGLNQGLVLAEIELPNVHVKPALPSYLDQEVTGDVRYYNQYLSSHPYTAWSER